MEMESQVSPNFWVTEDLGSCLRDLDLEPDHLGCCAEDSGQEQSWGKDQESVVKLRPEMWLGVQFGNGFCKRGWILNAFWKYILRTLLTGQAVMVNNRKAVSWAALRF